MSTWLGRCCKCSGRLYIEFGTGDTVCLQCGKREVKLDARTFNFSKSGIDYQYVASVELTNVEVRALKRVK